MPGEPLESKGQLDLLVLSVLSHGTAHGYAIITALRRRSDGQFDLAEGTVYPALRRLEDLQLVKSSWDSSSGRRRRVYEITTAGRRTLSDRHDRWNRFVAGVDAVLGWAP